jgi:hypothetical protein
MLNPKKSAKGTFQTAIVTWESGTRAFLSSLRKQSYVVGNPYGRSDMLHSDVWDEYSTHILVWHCGLPVGAMRFSTALNGRLPVSAACSDIKFNPTDAEISRIVIHPQYRHGFVFLKLIRRVSSLFSESVRRVFADVCIGGQSNVRLDRYFDLGFREFGRRYWDHRYDSRSYVLVASISELAEAKLQAEVKWKKYF